MNYASNIYIIWSSKKELGALKTIMVKGSMDLN
jgi:hypothetical protein